MNNKTNIEEDIGIIEDKKDMFFNTLYEVYRQSEVKPFEKAIENILADREKWKRLAEQNLKNSEEFKNNMCEHRCIKNNEILELQVKANKYDALVEKIKETVEDLANMEVDGEVFTTAVNFARNQIQELIPEEE